ncbi:carboxy terminal-processing peptidase [Alginatibacterium sediminis]|uniref:Carboxy terminal-processing peptidase n=1 Tax=Alginatibacterium sediminis TaxID=2164068 RepID=A0A420EHI7_9ALTE|nr:carboxy terminal-processing peptidase [Alginatibacterium sediminis]RKF20114.1 carboxy terminal-processing peptidase [Alginatibacterium sediminis]
MKILRWIAFSAVCFFSASLLAQDHNFDVGALPTLKAETQHATSAKRISALFSRSHYRNVDFDDELSSQVYDRYLKQLDYNRSLFTQNDIRSFERYRFQLDQDIPQGRLDAMYTIFSKNLERRYSQLLYSLELLDIEMDFGSDDEYTFDRSDLAWPSDETELQNLWRSKVEYDALNLKLTGKEWPEISKLLTKRYSNALKRLTQTESEDVFQSAMLAYSRTIEPHTSYLSPRTADRFQTEMNLSLEGIGAVLQAEDDYTVIRSLVPGGPAAMSKSLVAEDRIVGVAQDQAEMVDIIGWRLDDVVELIKGPKGTVVRLEILSKSGKADGQTNIVSIVRDKVRLEDRAAKSEVMEINDRKIGVIEVPSFYVNLSEDVSKELQKLEQAKVDSIIVDLRSNGGGALTEATAMTGLFIPQGPVVQVRDQLGRVSVNASSNDAPQYSGPLMVLIDRYSASASEIFAAALQDYGRALIVGEQSFGKGTVQQHRGLGRIYDLYDQPLGHVQYTIAKFYRIDGGSTQHRGVIPDLSFPTAVLPEETGESLEENALPWDSIKAANYEPLGSAVQSIEELKARHELRIQNDPDFAYILSDIEEYRSEKDKKTVSLNEAKRLAIRESKEQAQLTQLNEQLVRAGFEAIEKLDDIPEEYEPEDVFLTEAALIAVDDLSL